jgi:hypothetical protein
MVGVTVTVPYPTIHLNPNPNTNPNASSLFLWMLLSSKDGELLCDLVNTLKSGTVSKIHRNVARFEPRILLFFFLLSVLLYLEKENSSFFQNAF